MDDPTVDSAALQERVKGLVDTAKAYVDAALDSLGTRMDAAAKREAEIVGREKALRAAEEKLRQDRERFEWESRQVSDCNARAEDIIRLNVGGTKMEVSRATLCQFEDSMLWAMFSGRHKLAYDTDGRVFLDRSAECFEYLLDFLRGNGKKLPPLPADEREIERIREEFDYFLVPFHGAALHEVFGHEEYDMHVFTAHEGPVFHVSLTDKYIVSCGDDGTVRVWDAETYAPLHTLRGHTEGVWTVKVDGDRAVSGSFDKTVRLWSLADGACLREHDEPGEWVYSVAVSDTYYASAGLNGEGRVRDIKTGELQESFRGAREVFLLGQHVLCYCCNPDRIVLRDIVSHVAVREFHLGELKLSALCFSPAIARLAVTGTSAYCVWSARTGQVLHSGDVHYDDDSNKGPAALSKFLGGFFVRDCTAETLVGCMNSSPDVILMDIETGEVTRLNTGHKHDINWVSVCGSTIASASMDFTVRIYRPRRAKYR